MIKYRLIIGHLVTIKYLFIQINLDNKRYWQGVVHQAFIDNAPGFVDDKQYHFNEQISSESLIFDSILKILKPIIDKLMSKELSFYEYSESEKKQIDLLFNILGSL